VAEDARADNRVEERTSKSAKKGSPRKNAVYYVAAADDTVSSVARTFGVSSADVVRTNRLGSTDKLVAGTLLRIPVPTQAIRGLEKRTRGAASQGAKRER
jgi:LysM repeat protein